MQMQMQTMQAIQHVLNESSLEARPYQVRVITKTVQKLRGEFVKGDGNLEEPCHSVLIESPCGSGKTPMGLIAARVMQLLTGSQVGWMAMRRELLAQAAAENTNKGINVEGIRCFSMFDKEPPTNVDGLVVDECQHDACDSAMHIHNTIRPRWIAGLSATPYRVDRAKLLFDSVVRDAGIHQLIQDGYLSQYDHYTIPDWKPETVAAFYLRDPKRWGKSVFYFRERHECHTVQNALRASGIESEVVTGDSDREAQLARFNQPGNGTDFHLPVINMMVLTEGFDCPSLKTAWVRDSGKGTTIQMGGRAFRLHPDHPIKQIVQGAATRWPFLKTALPHSQNVWIDGWRTLNVNPEINRVAAEVRQAVASIDVQMPKFIRERMDRRKQRRGMIDHG